MNWTYTQDMKEAVLNEIKKNGIKNFGQVIKKGNTIYIDVTEILKEHRFTGGQKAIMCIRLNNGHEFWNSASIWFEIGVDRECPEYCRHSTSDLKLRKGCGYGMSIIMLLSDFELSILSDDFNKLKVFDFNLYKGLGWDDVLFDSFLFYRRYENEAAMMENEEDCRKHWDWEWTGIENYYKDL